MKESLSTPAAQKQCKKLQSFTLTQLSRVVARISDLDNQASSEYLAFASDYISGGVSGWLSSCLGVAIDHTPAEFRYKMTTRSSRVQVQSPTSSVSPHPVFLTGIGIWFCLNRDAKTGDTFRRNGVLMAQGERGPVRIPDKTRFVREWQ